VGTLGFSVIFLIALVVWAASYRHRARTLRSRQYRTRGRPRPSRARRK